MPLIMILIALTLSVIIYNLIPLLIYLFKSINKSEPIRAKQIDPKSPQSPWIKVSSDEVSEKRRLVDECSTVSEMFGKVVDKFSDKRCFGYRPILAEEDERQSDGKLVRKRILGDYQWFSYKDIGIRVQTVSTGLTKTGVKTKDLVMIYADTRLEWMISCQSLFRLGASVGTIYTNLNTEAVIHAINETEVTHLIIGWELLVKLQPIIDKISGIKCIVYMSDEYKDQNLIQMFSETQRKRINFYSFESIEELGRNSIQVMTTNRMDGIVDQRPEDTAVLMYTSGSTSVPKGVLISHKNLLLAIKAFYAFAGALSEDDIYCAFLPLAHCLEICAELSFISIGIRVGYASVHTLTDRSIGLKKGLKGDITLLRPTVMAAVPLILDRISYGISEELEKKHHLFKTLINFVLKYKSFWTKIGFNTPIVNYLVCRQFKGLLGGRIKFIASGGATLRPQTHEFIRNLFDVIVLQGYGLTETTASATIMDLDDLSVGRVGSPLVGVQIKLVDWTEGGYRVTDRPNPRGEIVIGGDSVTNGYYKNSQLTEQYYKEENGIKWFYTGDIGQVYPDGTFKIIDRKKDIIKLSNGEYVSLSKIEEELKQNPFVDNVCIYGNSVTNRLIALIIPNSKRLEILAKDLSKSSEMSLKELCTDCDIKAKVLSSIKEFCIQSNLLKAEIPTNIKLCSDEWLPDNGLVTSSFKLKRKAIEDHYWEDIKQIGNNSQTNGLKVS